MASLAWPRSRVSGATRRNPIDTAAERAFTRTSATAILSNASRSSSSEGSCSPSATDHLRRPNLLRVDLLERGARLEALDLALGGVLLGNREERRGADLLRSGQHPVEELLDPLPRGNRLPPTEVDELPGEAVANGAPEVLLDESMRER